MVWILLAIFKDYLIFEWFQFVFLYPMLKRIHYLLNTKTLCLCLFFLLGKIEEANSQCINAFPYLQDFEVDNGGWLPGGFNIDWAWGEPLKTNITQAGSGSKCWITGGLTFPNYFGGEKSYLTSPCFDFSNLTNPYIEFKIFWDTERQYDGANLQYSIDNGVTWQNVGSITDPVDCRNKNWYNNGSIGNLGGLAFPQSGWSGNTKSTQGACLGGSGSGQWLTASHCITDLAGEPSVKFRFTFGSGIACNDYDGFAFDSLYIGESSQPVIDIKRICNGDLSLSVSAESDGCPSQYSWDFGDPASSGNYVTGITADHVFSSAGSYTVKLTTIHPCIGAVVVTKTISFPDVQLQVGDVTCNNGSDGYASALVLTPASTTLIWLPSGSQVDTLKNISVGTYALTVLGGTNDCKTTIPFEVIYGPDAFPLPDLGNDQFICPGQSIKLTPGIFNSYQWNTGETSAEINVDSASSYIVTVTNSAGCTDLDTINFELGCGTDIWLPKAFTPDEDGVNDYFKAEGIDVPSFTMNIFNRYGQPIFKSDNISLGWDGKFDGTDAPIGVYGYTCRYTFRNGEKGVKRGSFLLLR